MLRYIFVEQLLYTRHSDGLCPSSGAPDTCIQLPFTVVITLFTLRAPGISSSVTDILLTDLLMILELDTLKLDMICSSVMCILSFSSLLMERAHPAKAKGSPFPELWAMRVTCCQFFFRNPKLWPTFPQCTSFLQKCFLSSPELKSSLAPTSCNFSQTYSSLSHLEIYQQ